MFGSQILEVAIGVIFIFLLFSMICSAIREGMEAWLKTRAAYLEFGIRELLHDRQGTGLVTAFFNNPLIYGLFSGEYTPAKSAKHPPILAKGRNLPSYIPSKNFALALMDIAARGPKTNVVSSDPNSPIVSLDSIRRNLLNISNPFIQRVLLSALDSGNGDLMRVQLNLEDWYNSSMDRISGWYKRSTQKILFWIGLVVAIGINVNTITIASYLYRHDAVRTAIVARAEAVAKDSNFSNENYQQAKKELNSLGLPIGWADGSAPFKKNAEGGSYPMWNRFLIPVLGWLLTALAATMGAPFWFDILNRIMVIRSTVKPHEKSPEEGSQDNQTGKVKTIDLINQGQANALKIPETGLTPRLLTVPLAFIPSPLDDESEIDGCEVTAEKITLDQELPIAQGGVV
ncbi:MAG: hypothetical protein NVS9B7_29760 [Flavisolibacter sp.]